MTMRIIGTGSAVPEKIITNEDLAGWLDTSDEWIRTRTGIRERHVAAEGEDAAALAAEAGKKALENAKMRPQEIELVLAATCSSGNYFPGVGCCVQDKLGLVNAAAMDLGAACSGFLFALHTAYAYIMAGIYERILVIGTETFSRVVDWKDRSTCVLFGDGAGACVVSKEDEGLIAMSQHSDGSRGDVLVCTGEMLPSPAAEEAPMKPLLMDGQAVFRFAVKTMPECIHNLLKREGIEPEEIRYFVLHQANRRILQSVAKRLGVPEEKFPMNLDKMGNTSAASIPILLDEMNRSGRLERGDKVILAGFGAGLTWGVSLLVW